MTRGNKQVGSALFVVLGLAVYVGCGAPEPSERGESTGETSAALSAACADAIPGATTPWLPQFDCSCPYTGDKLTECQYEVGVIQCLQNQGFTFNCLNAPPLPVVSVTAGREWLGDFNVVDLNAYFPNNCAKQYAARSCMSLLNGTTGGNPPTPYTSRPVSAQLTHHCTAALDPCRSPRGGGGVDTLDVFDPCSTKACTPSQ